MPHQPLTSPHRRRLARLLALLLALTLVAAACTGDDDGDESSTAEESTDDSSTTSTAPTTTTTESPDPTAAETIALSPCPDGVPLECGLVTVPVDHEDDSAGTLDLAVAIHRATSPEDRIGYLLINPGGPGGSGVEYAYAASFGPGAAFSQEVLARFDIVGFDPRGVGASGPTFACGEPGEQLALLNSIEGAVDTDAEIEAGEQAVALCQDSMGPAAALLGSESVARDMDVIRGALGADQISYFGASYGSTLGAWYATLFPERVRAMVVDGADNPVDDLSDEAARIESSLEEGRQFEILLEEALLACDSDECPIFNDGDPIGFYLDQIDDLELVNEAFAGDPTAGPLAIITPLYDRATWPELWNGLAALSEGDAQPLIDQAAFQLGEPGVANFTGHVNCLDQWSLQPQFDRATQLEDSSALDEAAAAELPLLSQLDLLTITDPCPFFDTIVGEPLDRPLDGGDVPILVIGNPSDPATPFSESEELVETTLSNGFLVEADHPSHVVYPANECVNDLVEAVLVDVEFPAETRTVCPASPIDDGDSAAGDDLPATDEELAEILTFVCLASAAEGTDQDALETACEEAVEQIQAEFGFDEILAAIQGEDDTTGEALGGILDAAFDANGITPADDTSE